MYPSMRLLRRNLLSLSVVAAMLPGASFAQQLAADLPAGPLGQSLSRFASQRGMALSFDPSLTDGRQAAALQGDVGDREGVERLLKGSGLHLVPRGDGSYTLARDPAHDGQAIPLSTLRIGGQANFPYQEGMTLDRDYIRNQPSGNGDIGTLLRINPSVQYDNAQQSSFTPGEISPAEISINGAKFYQNAFTLDGMNFNNDIDPAQEGSPYKLAAVPGASQGMALDTDLLDQVTVLDSNISAAYGGFNGGVVEATTRKPTHETHVKVSEQLSRSAWTRYHVDKSLREDTNNASSWGDGEPEFTKTVLRATAEGYVTDTLGLLADITRKRSTIPTRFYSSHLVDQFGYQKETQRRAIDNYFLKAAWTPSDRLDVQASVMYAPEANHYYRSNIRDSGIDIKRGGLQANLSVDWDRDWGTIRQRLGWSRTEQSRDPDSDDYQSWYFSDSKDWGTNNNTLQGEFGDIEQKQKTLSYKLDVNWNPVTWLGATHRFSVGTQLSRQNVYYARLSESSTYVTPKSTTTCTNRAGVVDDVACAMGVTHTSSKTTNGWPGQYLTQRTRYATGRFAFDTNSWGVYAEDDIRIDRLQLRPGIRVDGDSYMHQDTWAPRLAASFDVFGDNRTLIQAGANRYYGRNVAAWRLSDGINRLRYNGEKRTSLDSPWTVGTQATNTVRFSDLKVAYSDELMLGVEQRWAGMLFNLKAVNRKGRDEVIQVAGKTLGEPSTDPTLASNYTTWTNDGRSETNTFTLAVAPLHAVTWLGTTTTGLLSLDYTDVKYASPTYFDEGDLFYANNIIQYRGKFIHYADRPAENWNRPWTARLSTTTRIPALDLTWTNFLRYRAGYTDIGDTGRNVEYQGELVDVWDSRKFKGALTWDMRFSWEKPIGGQAIFANLDIGNVLDKSVVYGVSPAVTSAPYYETGRSFWIEVGYRF